MSGICTYIESRPWMREGGRRDGISRFGSVSMMGGGGGGCVVVVVGRAVVAVVVVVVVVILVVVVVVTGCSGCSVAC